MNKGILAGAIVILGGVFIGGPYLAGTQAQAHINGHVERITKVPGYTAQIENYQRNWRDSQVVLSYGLTEGYIKTMTEGDKEISPALLEALHKGLKFRLDIEHGPLLGGGLGLMRFSGQSDLDNYPAAVKVKEKLGIDSFFEVNGTLDFAGNALVHMNSPEFEVENGEGNGNTQVVFRGMTSETRVTELGQHIESEGTLPGLEVKTDNGTFNLQAIRFDMQQDVVTDWLWVGDFKMQLEGMDFDVIKAGSEQSAELGDIDLTMKSWLDEDETLSMNFGYQIGQVKGKEVEVSDIALQFGLERIDQQFIQTYYDLMVGAFENASNEQALNQVLEQKMAAMLKAELPSALAKSPTFSIAKLAATYQGNSFDFNAKASFDGESLPDPIQLENASFWIERSVVNGKLDVDEALMLQAVEMALTQQLTASSQGQDVSKEQIAEYAKSQSALTLSTLTQQGMLTKTEAGYSADFLFKDGQATVNGKAIPLPVR